MDAPSENPELRAELAAKDARIAQLEQQVAKLSGALASLRERLGQSSSNSNLPPPSDVAGKRTDDQRKKRRKGKGPKRKRGGQKGHRGSHRALLPAEQVDEFVDGRSTPAGSMRPSRRGARTRPDHRAGWTAR